MFKPSRMLIRFQLTSRAHTTKILRSLIKIEELLDLFDYYYALFCYLNEILFSWKWEIAMKITSSCRSDDGILQINVEPKLEPMNGNRMEFRCNRQHQQQRLVEFQWWWQLQQLLSCWSLLKTTEKNHISISFTRKEIWKMIWFERKESDRPRIFLTDDQLSNHKLIIKGIHHFNTKLLRFRLKILSDTYLNQVGQLHAQCGTYQPCNRGKRSNELALMGHLLGKPWPYHDV